MKIISYKKTTTTKLCRYMPCLSFETVTVYTVDFSNKYLYHNIHRYCEI